MRVSQWVLLGLLLVAGLALVALTRWPRHTHTDMQADANPALTGTAEQAVVTVGLTEFTVTLSPDRVPAGNVVFHVRNTGTAAHGFTVAGYGIEQSTPVLQPGGTADLRVNEMPPGTYAVYCPVGNHADRGMRNTLTVTNPGCGCGQ